MDKSARRKFIEDMVDLMHDFVREQYGEETEAELTEMAELCTRIHICMNNSEPIPLGTVDRYNQLCRRHSPKKEE